jgi:hypothetical protein
MDKLEKILLQEELLKEQENIILSLKNEISSLNEHIDIIVDDLVQIKESKCWIYTKPLRNLQEILRVKDA